jgi:GNAT superfamily N-acetyltransferase
MALEIREVRTRRDLKRFVRYPLSLYRGNTCWVPPLFFDEMNTLRRDRNPAFEHCEARTWLAVRDGRIVGRVAAILNRRHAEKWNQKYMRFGWIDFEDDAETARALLAAVEAWARETGMEAVHGPLGFTDLDREGMLVEGFDQLGTMATIYNHAYYPEHLERAGYAKDTDWVEYEIRVPESPNETVERVADIALRRYHLRLLEARGKKDLLPYAKDLFDLIDDAYKNLYGTVPLTRRQVDAYVKQYFGFIQPDFVPIVLDEDGRMVAFGITMPSLSKALQKAKGNLLPFGFWHLLRALRRNDRADLYLVAVRSEYQRKGVNAILIHKMNEVYNRLGIRTVESNPELETNRLVQEQWKFFEKRNHKRRRCFIKRLDGPPVSR